MFLSCLAVGTGGFIGSIMRYLISLIPILHKGLLPYQTLIANVLGAFLIGLFIGYDQSHDEANKQILLLFKVGLCGGFTTFSTFAVESSNFLREGEWILSIIYIVVSIILCILGVILGRYLMTK